MARHRTALAIALGTALSVASCGGSSTPPPSPAPPPDPRPAVVEAVKHLEDATLEGDTTGYCELLTDAAKGKVAKSEKAPDCEQAMKKVFDLAGQADLARIRRVRDALGVGDVALSDNRAFVTLESGRRVRLRKSHDGEWLVSEPPPRR